MIYKEFDPKMAIGFAVLSVILLVYITVQSLGSAPASVNVTHFDKVAHALAYFVLGLAVLPALAKVRVLFSWVFLCAYGILIEGLQGIMKLGRTADILDVLANASGALCAVLMWAFISFIARRLPKKS